MNHCEARNIWEWWIHLPNCYKCNASSSISDKGEKYTHICSDVTSCKEAKLLPHTKLLEFNDRHVAPRNRSKINEHAFLNSLVKNNDFHNQFHLERVIHGKRGRNWVNFQFTELNSLYLSTGTSGP